MERRGHPIITNISTARFTTNFCGVVSQLSCGSHTHAHTRNNDDDDERQHACSPSIQLLFAVTGCLPCGADVVKPATVASCALSVCFGGQFRC